ncbi:hypothetical protein [Streptomyces sp. NPDC001100]
MSDKAALEEDRIVSDSGLLTLLRNDPESAAGAIWQDEPGGGGPAHVLDLGVLRDDVLPRWSKGVDKQVKGMIRRARGTLEVLSGEALYSHLDDPTARTAALVAELFRNPATAKNAGRLDVRRLQQRLRTALRHGGPLRFEIAWGQAKRGAGGLKTLGPSADLAEAYALARLTALARAAAELLDHEPGVRLTVLTGGSRFTEALLTCPARLAAYDHQRARIADGLAPNGILEFRDYAHTSDDWRDRYERHLAAVTDSAITARFPTVLFNVDWENVVRTALDGATAHGVPLPGRVAGWLAADPARRGPLLTRAAVGCLANPALQTGTPDDLADVLEEGIAYYSQITWEATRAYVAVHAADRDARPDDPSGAVRLTVHEKRDRPDVPAVATLGVRGADLLSQHVAVRLAGPGSATVFETVAEITAHAPDAVPVRLTGAPAGGALFDWLAGTAQPLCFAPADTDPHRFLGAALDPEQA